MGRKTAQFHTPSIVIGMKESADELADQSADHCRMSLPRIHIGRPQRIAALLLLVFLAECLWVVAHQPLSSAFSLHGDGVFAYRIVELPLALLHLAHCDGTRAALFVLHLPFVFFAVWMGGGLWWVSRRLFGNEGGFIALALYCFCPTVVRLAVTPHDDLLAMWGLYGLVYTAIGVAHAMQGPRRKWRPRIALLTLALGLTAAAHFVAAVAGFLAALCFMLYLAERRRTIALRILLIAAIGAFATLFTLEGFHPAALRAALRGSMSLSLAGVYSFANDRSNFPILIATGVVALLYIALRRSRYFGNTAPLLIVLALTPLVYVPSVVVQIGEAPTASEPYLWALPFFFTFLGGVFADALETRARKLFLALTGAILAAQAILCLATI